MFIQRQPNTDSSEIKLRIPVPIMMTAREEITLIRQAIATGSSSPESRRRLAHLLFKMDFFDEAIDIFESLAKGPPEFNVFHPLAICLLARETPADNRAAKVFAQKAVDSAKDNFSRSNALAILGKVHRRLSEYAQARCRFIEALDENIANKDAYKRLAMLDFQEGRYQEVCDYAEQMVANCVAHARVLGMLPLAFAKLGRINEARELFGLEKFLRQRRISPPSGWATIEDFNRELTTELLTHPGIRYERYGTASTRSWRVDEPALARFRLVPELQKLILREVTTYIAQLPESCHPWLRTRPSSVSIRGWSVMTDGDGFEEWHVHQSGWLSGAYYVHVPDFIVNGDTPDGCIAFGLPSGIVGDDPSAEFGSSIFRPHSGLLLLFPSHAFHRTFPHNGDSRRICFAFDLVPET
jgi:tetratricopeptide (TPR) repeat protein